MRKAKLIRVVSDDHDTRPAMRLDVWHTRTALWETAVVQRTSAVIDNAHRVYLRVPPHGYSRFIVRIPTHELPYAKT